MDKTSYKELRKRLGNQTQVALLLGVTRETVCRREAGQLPIGKEAEMAIVSLKMWIKK